MKSKIIKEKSLERVLEFHVPAKKVDASFLKSYQKIQKKLRLAGFRQGKAPLNQIRSHYKDQVVKEVLEDLFPIFYPLALKEQKLNPVSRPFVLNVQLEEGKDSKIVVQIEVHPKVEVKHFLNLEIRKEPIVVSPEEVEESLRYLKKSLAVYEESESPSAELKKGDFVLVDMKLFHRRNEEVLSLKDWALPVDSEKKDDWGRLLKEHLTGLKPGAKKTVIFSFSKNSSVQSLAGKTLKISLKIKAFKYKKTLEKEEDFNKKLKSGAFEKLKATIHEKLISSKKEIQREEQEEKIIDQLIDKNPLEVPKTLVMDYKEKLIENMKTQEPEMSKDEQEAFLKKKDKDLEELAKQEVHSHYLLTQLIKDLKIELKPEEIPEAIERDFSHKPPKEVEEEIKQAGRWEDFLLNATKRKVLAYLIDKATVVKD